MKVTTLINFYCESQEIPEVLGVYSSESNLYNKIKQSLEDYRNKHADEYDEEFHDGLLSKEAWVEYILNGLKDNKIVEDIDSWGESKFILIENNVK